MRYDIHGPPPLPWQGLTRCNSPNWDRVPCNSPEKRCQPFSLLLHGSERNLSRCLVQGDGIGVVMQVSRHWTAARVPFRDSGVHPLWIDRKKQPSEKVFVPQCDPLPGRNEPKGRIGRMEEVMITGIQAGKPERPAGASRIARSSLQTVTRLEHGPCRGACSRHTHRVDFSQMTAT